VATWSAHIVVLEMVFGKLLKSRRKGAYPPIHGFCDSPSSCAECLLVLIAMR